MKWNEEKKQIPIEYQNTLACGDTLTLLKYPLLSSIEGVEHCFTTRLGGVSEGIFSTLNLSFTRGDDEAAVRENYRRVAETFGVTSDRIVCSDQTHTTNVRLVTEEDAGKGVTRPKDYTDVDGLITNVPGLLLATFYADCVPLYFVDPVHKAIGLSHSGWRGTVNRMGRETLLAMQKNFDTNPADVYASIGPSICQDCYEVSLDVAEAFVNEFGNEVAIEKAPVDEERKFLLDLWKANEIILQDAGILPENLEVTTLCTCCNSKLLFSHRASHGQRGNLGAFLMLAES